MLSCPNVYGYLMPKLTDLVHEQRNLIFQLF